MFGLPPYSYKGFGEYKGRTAHFHLVVFLGPDDATQYPKDLSHQELPSCLQV